MDSHKKTALAFGTLLIAGIVFGALSSVPALEQSDYLIKLASIKRQVLMAVFFQFSMATVYVSIAALSYSIIRKDNRVIAVGYFGFRIIGAVFLYFGIVSLLLLLLVSRLYTIEGQPDQSHFRIIGELLRAGRDWANHIGMILPWSTGGLILYSSFYRMKIVPEWLSIWGFIGSISTFISTLLLMFDTIEIVTVTYFLMNMPTALLELTLAIYLIFKGFRSHIEFD